MSLFHKKNINSIAAINDGALILSLTDAREPCVWRMELAQARLSALELKDDQGTTILQMRTPKGDIHTVATYDSRSRALEILTLVASTLSGIRVTSDPAELQAKPTNSNWLWFGGALVIILIFISFMSANAPPQTQKEGTNSTTKSTPATTGEPLSADDFLNR